MRPKLEVLQYAFMILFFMYHYIDKSFFIMHGGQTMLGAFPATVAAFDCTKAVVSDCDTACENSGSLPS
jgi:hypothetical protein